MPKGVQNKAYVHYKSIYKEVSSIGFLTNAKNATIFWAGKLKQWLTPLEVASI